MSEVIKCKRCKGTGEIGGCYQNPRECFDCMGTGDTNWQKYWKGVNKRY